MTMAAYDMTHWCDLARGVVAPAAARRIKAHLARSERARRQLGRFQRVAAVARTDAGLAIPEHALRVAKAAGSLRRPATLRCRRPFRVLFDSLLNTVPTVGTREICSSHQQLVFRADDYTVEVRVERETNPYSQVVVGQLLRHREETQPVPQVPVLVLSDGRVVGRDLTSRFGEFQAAGLPPEPLELCLLVGHETCIDIPLGGPQA